MMRALLGNALRVAARTASASPRALAASSAAAATCAATAACAAAAAPDVAISRRSFIRNGGCEEELLQDYERMGDVGSGGFGAVSRARHRASGLMCAIKTIGNSEFMDEIEALSDLDHPNIVRLIRYYQAADERLFLIEELCTGETLENWMKRSRTLHPDAAAVVMRQILRAVLCCHSHGIAHRDLKPDNFVFASPDERAELKLIDFGLTQIHEADQSGPKDGAFAATAGTLEFSAPETLPSRDESGRLLRKARYTAAADLWACGAIFYEMLCGEPLVNLDRLRTSSAEFNRMVKACFGAERDLLDDTASMLRSERFLTARLKVAKSRAPPAAYELLELLLRVDPEERITAQQALQHRFVANAFRRAQDKAGGEQRTFDTHLLEKLRAFSEAPALTRLAVLVEAHLLGPQDEADGMRIQILTFREADESGEGVVDRQELEAVLRAHAVTVPADLGEVLSKIDASQDGAIGLIEFLAATMDPKCKSSEKLCRAAFRILDADGDGYLTEADIATVLSPSPRRDEAAKAILQSARPDANGRVHFARFLELMQQ